MSEREDREPLKTVRDLEQAKAAAIIATRYLKQSFDSPDLAALPKRLLAIAPRLLKDDTPKTTKPNW